MTFLVEKNDIFRVGLHQQSDWQEDVQGVVKYTEPVQERKPEAVQEVMPAPTVLA